jgi:hypothetical protein
MGASASSRATRVFSAAEIERWVPILRASGTRVD